MNFDLAVSQSRSPVFQSQSDEKINKDKHILDKIKISMKPKRKISKKTHYIKKKLFQAIKDRRQTAKSKFIQEAIIRNDLLITP